MGGFVARIGKPKLYLRDRHWPSLLAREVDPKHAAMVPRTTFIGIGNRTSDHARANPLKQSPFSTKWSWTWVEVDSQEVQRRHDPTRHKGRKSRDQEMTSSFPVLAKLRALPRPQVFVSVPAIPFILPDDRYHSLRRCLDVRSWPGSDKPVTANDSGRESPAQRPERKLIRRKAGYKHIYMYLRVLDKCYNRFTSGHLQTFQSTSSK